MQRLCNKFLTSTAFPLYEHRNVKRGDLPDLLPDRLNGSTLANDNIEGLFTLRPLFGRILVYRNFFFQRIDPFRQRLDLLWTFEHDASYGTDNFPVVTDRMSGNDALDP